MANYPSNEERTAEYLSKFNKEKTLKYLLGEQDLVIFDVGANVGSSLEEFKQYWPGSVVHCFEPQEECWGPLEACAKRVAPQSSFINRVAAGESAGALPFYSNEISSGLSGFNKMNINSTDSIDLKRLRSSAPEALDQFKSIINHERVVPLIRLDDYLQKSSIKKINFMKMDTQGHEPEVLAGLGDHLKNVDVILTELMFYDYYEKKLSFSDIEKHLLPAGFRLYDISHISKNPMNGRTDWVDVIYVNERLKSSLA
jgi:FkbM family methyltransferase